jgi:hypothetical protein
MAKGRGDIYEHLCKELCRSRVQQDGLIHESTRKSNCFHYIVLSGGALIESGSFRRL